MRAGRKSAGICSTRTIKLGLVTLEFIEFCIVVTAVYYFLPGILQNLWLLGVSVYYILQSEAPVRTLIFLGGAIVIVYLAGLAADQSREGRSALKKAVFLAALLACLGFLLYFKYQNFLIDVLNLVSPVKSAAAGTGAAIVSGRPHVSIAAPLGISFYTLQLLGYLIDVYTGKYKAERNPLKIALFGLYFPQLTSGPINRYNDLEPYFAARRKFNPEGIAAGALRFVWGLFKKLVISERAAVLVNTIFGAYEYYNGLYILFGVSLFAVQLYTDFSGCMDIVMGASKMLGIPMAENFDTPVFSQSVTEFWRRWHITLGTWFKDYVMYPLQKSNLLQAIGDKSKKAFGKKKGKKVPLYLAMLILWLGVGFWHGGAIKYVIGSGVLHFTYIVIGRECKPLFDKIAAFLQLDTETAGFRLFRRVRTFLLVCSGFMFFRADSVRMALGMYRSLFSWNAGILTLSGLTGLGLDLQDIFVLVLAIILLLFVENIQQKTDITKAIAQQNLPARWLICLGLVFATMIFGMYGANYDAASFIYANF